MIDHLFGNQSDTAADSYLGLITSELFDIVEEESQLLTFVSISVLSMSETGEIWDMIGAESTVGDREENREVPVASLSALSQHLVWSSTQAKGLITGSAMTSARSRAVTVVQLMVERVLSDERGLRVTYGSLRLILLQSSWLALHKSSQQTPANLDVLDILKRSLHSTRENHSGMETPPAPPGALRQEHILGKFLQPCFSSNWETTVLLFIRPSFMHQSASTLLLQLGTWLRSFETHANINYSHEDAVISRYLFNHLKKFFAMPGMLPFLKESAQSHLVRTELQVASEMLLESQDTIEKQKLEIDVLTSKLQGMDALNQIMTPKGSDHDSLNGNQTTDNPPTRNDDEVRQISQLMGEKDEHIAKLSSKLVSIQGEIQQVEDRYAAVLDRALEGEKVVKQLKEKLSLSQGELYVKELELLEVSRQVQVLRSQQEQHNIVAPAEVVWSETQSPSVSTQPSNEITVAEGKNEENESAELESTKQSLSLLQEELASASHLIENHKMENDSLRQRLDSALTQLAQADEEIMAKQELLDLSRMKIKLYRGLDASKSPSV